MIDALMMAYTVEMISIEKVVTCVKRFSTFSASKELPFDLEDAMIFWINKVMGIQWRYEANTQTRLFCYEAVLMSVARNTINTLS